MKENIDKFEHVVGEGGVHDCIRVRLLDQLRNLVPGDEGYIYCLPISYEVKKKHELHRHETETNLVKRRKGTAKEQ